MINDMGTPKRLALQDKLSFRLKPIVLLLSTTDGNTNMLLVVEDVISFDNNKATIHIIIDLEEW
jgi:hypothetical protein